MKFIASDMDGTLLPNNGHSFDPDAYRQFRERVEDQNNPVVLACITGRHLELALEGIEEYNLPLPDYIAGDVGTTIYKRDGQKWIEVERWKEHNQKDFGSANAQEILTWFAEYSEIRSQEAEKQNTFKISFYHDLEHDAKQIQQNMEKVLQEKEVNAVVVMSIDHNKNLGLIDILPKNATKEEALRFLVQELNMTAENVLYCGDTGNDLLPMTAGFPAVLVGNATENIRAEALDLAKKRGTQESLFFAKKNYAEGILEAMEFFWKEN